METIRQLWQRMPTVDEKRIPILLVALFAMLLYMKFEGPLNSWARRYSAETEAAAISQLEELRKHDLAKERDRIALEKERKELGLDVPSTQALNKLGDVFIRVGPYALLFFSIAQAWKVFEDQRSSRLRLALAVSFSVIVVGFVLVVGGYVAPTSLRIGFGQQQTQITSESLGVVVVAIGAAMSMASFLTFRPKSDCGQADEA